MIKIIKTRNDFLLIKNLKHLRYLSDNISKSDEWSVSSFTSAPIDETRQRVAKRPQNLHPDHLPQCRKYQRQKPWWKYRYFINVNPIEDETPEWTQSPEYPPLKDNSKEGIDKQIRMEWYNAIKRLPTAQQKEYEICKHYSHLSYILEPIQRQYNCLPLQQFITRTHLISGLPDSYNQMNVDSILDENLKQQIIDSIAVHLFQTKQRKPSFEMKTSHKSNLGFPSKENRLNIAKHEDIIEDVVSIIRNGLQSKYNHLFDLQMDLSPNVCSSWWHRDFPIPFPKKKWFPNETFDQQFTYKATHSLNLRTEKPLPPVISLEDDICTKSEIPEYKYRLIKFGYFLVRHTLTTLPGFWSDRSNGFDFPNLICHSREGLRIREEKNEKPFDDIQQVLDGMAIMSSFGWLHSLASNLGFTVYHELTYPLVTHVVITDGQFWSFYVYQLNTHSFHSDVDTNSLRNVCWSSGELKLFDSYENGKLVGINDEVLKILIKLMTRSPQLSEECNLRPYLSEPNLNEEEFNEVSYALRRRYSNWVDPFIKDRQKVHLWEKVYKYSKDASPLPHIRVRPKYEFKYPPFFKR